MTLENFSGKRIAVLGSGENHQHLIRYFEKHGIDFEIIDKWKRVEEIDISKFEIVFRTPGVAFSSKPIQDAIAKGTIIYSQTRLFFDLCPAKIIGITGTKGKGTTATLIYRILENFFRKKSQPSKVYLAGNIGRDPFEFLDELSARDIVVLELSSFQLQDMHTSPHIAVVLKITPEHLDYHKNFDEYKEAKTAIVKFQSPEDAAVLNYDSEITRAFASQTHARVFWNSVTTDVRPGCYVMGDKIMLEGAPILNVSEVGLFGRFNLENATAAIAAASAAGVDNREEIATTVSEFKGLPHRLELVAKIRDVQYYNDSFSTTPETASAALSAFDSPIILIVGGSEKNADYQALASAIAEKKVKALIAIGITGPKIAALSRSSGFVGKIYDTGLSDMEKIVKKASEIADSGDVVLLSPASASFDMFENYKERGELFKKYVNKLDLSSHDLNGANSI